jgi:branched-subunit amino acid aminotransferase/4-amino-4-deoxychorismate lyase
LRGKRAEEALMILSGFMDDSILFGMSSVRIIHGKGDGILRQVMRDELSTYKGSYSVFTTSMQTAAVRELPLWSLSEIPEVKTINYLMGIYKLPEIQEKGATDLLYHWEGKISELTRSNFFIIDQNDKIITPAKGILKGINRKHVLNVAKNHFEAEERDLFMEELKYAKEAFITGTTKKVMPVMQVDDQIIGDGIPGENTIKLQVLYSEYIDIHMKVN